jgi:hypothetical protein
MRTVWEHETPKYGIWQGYESCISDSETSRDSSLFCESKGKPLMDERRRRSITFDSALGYFLTMKPPDSPPTPMEQCDVPGEELPRKA